jgi:hypothetical protein
MINLFAFEANNAAALCLPDDITQQGPKLDNVPVIGALLPSRLNAEVSIPIIM